MRDAPWRKNADPTISRTEVATSSRRKKAGGTRKKVASFRSSLLRGSEDEVLKAVDGLLLLAAKMKPKDHSQSIVALGTRHFWEEALQLLVQGKEVDLISFNAGISACVKVQEWDQALAALAMMADRKVSPDNVSYNAAVTACAREQWMQALCLFEEMLQGGMADLISFNAALRACGNREDLATAIFQEMERHQLQPDRYSFNAMLSATGQWEGVLHLLKMMQYARYPPDHISCSTAVLGCVRNQRWDVALSIFFDAEGADLVAWISALQAAPHWEMVVALLQQMQKDSLKPDVVAYSTAISRCADEASNEAWQVALQLLQQSVVRNEVTYGAAVTVMAKSAQWQQAMALLAEAHQSRSVGTGTVNAAINACERALLWQLALELLESLEERADEISYCAAIGACAAATQWAKALEVATMVTAATLGAAIVACEAGGAWEHAVALLQQMQRSRLEADDIAFRAAMGACHSTVAMRWERSVDLLQRMQCTGLPPVTLSYNFAITAFGRGLQWTLAVSAVRMLRMQDLTPGIGTFATVSSACDRGLQWSRSLDLLRTSSFEGIQPSIMIFGASISAQEKVSRWRVGLGLLRSLKRQGLEAELVTCNSAMSACEKGSIWAWSIELLTEEMLRKDVVCDEISFNAAIGACRENWRAAGQCLEVMQTHQLTPDVVTCGFLLHEAQHFCGIRDHLSSLEHLPPRRQVESLELLEAIDGLPDAAISSFSRAVYRPNVYPALKQLILNPTGLEQGNRLHSSSLEKHFSLGAKFTMNALKDTGIGGSTSWQWICTARRSSWISLLSTESPAVAAMEPIAAAIAAWVSQSLQCKSRKFQGSWTGGFGAAEAGPPLPIFVEHDRSQHAERGLLQALLRGLSCES